MHIEGIEMEFVAQCLGVDPKNYKALSVQKHTDIGENNEEISMPLFGATMASDTLEQRKRRALAIFKVKCMNETCKNEYEFPGILHKEK